MLKYLSWSSDGLTATDDADQTTLLVGEAHVGPAPLLQDANVAQTVEFGRCCLLYTSDAADDMPYV